MEIGYKNLILISITLSIFACIAVITNLNFKEFSGRGNFEKFTRETDLFIFGAAIYCGSFLLLSNYDLRLIFLILCQPLIGKIKHKFFSVGFPALSLISMNFLYLKEIPLNLPFEVWSPLAQISKLLLFFMLTFLLLQIIHTRWVMKSDKSNEVKL